MLLILNADDLGLSSEVNAAVADALAAGLCTSASVLANGPATGELPPLLARFPKISFGVHLNLTEFAPLTGIGRLAARLRTGQLHPGIRPVAREEADAVYEEWCAQVLRVRDLGVRPSHLDSHQHVHYDPVLFRVLKRVQARFGIERVRGMAPWRAGGGAKALAQMARAAWFTRAIRMYTPESLTTDGFGSVTLFRELVDTGVLTGRSFEVMCHPGNPASPSYASEMDWLRTWDRRGFTPVSWWELR